MEKVTYVNSIEKKEDTVIDLKCWPIYFKALTTGGKNFEIRKNDRGFEVGHVLRLREWLPYTEAYTGLEARFRITYILNEFEGLAQGYVAMALEKL